MGEVCYYSVTLNCFFWQHLFDVLLPLLLFSPEMVPENSRGTQELEFWKISFEIFNWMIFRFHVNFQGCTKHIKTQKKHLRPRA